jgi:phosphohistidine phosphatase
MDLILVRHAIAGEYDPQRWPDDRDRPLTAEGALRFKTAARGLRRIVPTVQVHLSSPLARAWQTAKILEDVARWPAARRAEGLASGQSQIRLLEELAPYAAAESVALVGHEPDLSGLASFLIGGGDDARLQLKKGGVIYLRFDGEVQPAAARLLWLLTPAILRELAP